ncbi:hypothetical protein TA3x_003129 [Tundrisphaera sp. TA3]|uniref:hypothetical protein n=1 Tax=Tundrisphaera sp. TA3 TaxID=3435775 RepID=UPI003EBC7215
MDFQDIPPRRPTIRATDHLAIASVIALSLILFAGAEDDKRGRAEVADGIPFSVAFAVVGYFIGWTPTPRADGRPSWIDPFLTPIFLVLVLAYLYLVFKAGFVQPWATGSAVVFQIIALVRLGLRTS